MVLSFRSRRLFFVTILLLFFGYVIYANSLQPKTDNTNNQMATGQNSTLALSELDKLKVKGRAPKTGYSRDQFGNGWQKKNGCDTRNIILNRDLSNPSVDSNCSVVKGELNDPYTGKIIKFKRGKSTSNEVQIDHVVALSDAWQKGAQQLDIKQRIKLANDPMELLAVSGVANNQKSDGDAATWLPSNKAFRCSYVARQVAVKSKYNLWLTSAELDAIKNILIKCPSQNLPSS